MLASTILTASTRRRDETDSRNGAAYQAIRDRIVRLELAPATVIDERKLADEMQIGLTPVRHALRRLALENLVVILPRRGTLVADLHPADLSKLFEMRVELEALAARLAAARMTKPQAAALAALARETRCARVEILQAGVNGSARSRNAERSLEHDDLEAFNKRLIQLDRDMHRLLAEAAHNEFLLETLEWLYNHVLRLWNTGLHRVTALEQSMEEHCCVADAVLAGDGNRAAELMRAHVQHFQQEFLESTTGLRMPAERHVAPFAPQPTANTDVISISTDSIVRPA